MAESPYLIDDGGVVYQRGPVGWTPVSGGGPGPLRRVDPFGRPLIERGLFGIPTPADPYGPSQPTGPFGQPLHRPVSGPLGGPGGVGR